MASTYSTQNRLELPATGEQSGTWGATVNAQLQLLEVAVDGYVSVAMADANTTLTTVNGADDQARNKVVKLTGANTAVRNAVIPAVEKVYIVRNATTGGYGVQVKTSGGTGYTVANGNTALLYCDATDVYCVSSSFADPNADRIMFWDDSVGDWAALTVSTGLTLSGTSLTADVSASSSTVFTGKTIDGDDNTVQDLPYSAIKSTSRTGTSATHLVTGTAGTSGNLVKWDANGDAVDSTVVAANVYVSGGTDVAIADGGTGASTAANAFTALKQDATTSATGAIELATTAEVQVGTASLQALTPSNTAAAITEVTLTDGATVTVDFTTGFNFKLTLGGNRTLAASNYSGLIGRSGYIAVLQDGTGTRTLDTSGTPWINAGGTNITLTTTASATDVLFYQILNVSATAKILLSASKAVA